MKAENAIVLVMMIGLTGTATQAFGQQTPILDLAIPDRARMADHDDGIYVAGTLQGNLYVLDETGSYTVTSLGAGPIEAVRIENSHVAVAAGTTVLEFSLAGLTPVQQWQVNLGQEVRSVDLSGDGRYVAYLATGWYDEQTQQEHPNNLGVLQGGNIVARADQYGDEDALYFLDATRDMEYIAITDEPCPPGPDGEYTGVELFRFDGTSLSRRWGTVLMDHYETTEIRISEAKDYVAAATSSGTYMDMLSLADGSLLWDHETPDKEQFACDGDDDLRYVIGASQAWWRPYPWFVLKNLGDSYEILAEGTMMGPINDLDSNPDASLLAFGSDLGEYVLLSRTGDTVETVWEGDLRGIVDLIEVGDMTLLVGGDGFLTLIPEPATMALLTLGALAVLVRRRGK